MSACRPRFLGDQSLRWNAALRGQASKNVLYTSDQFAIGNRYTVRGFDGERTLAAEQGWYLRNEIEIPLAASGQALTSASTMATSWPRRRQLAGRSLTGAVVGARRRLRLNYDLFAGWALAKPDGFATQRPVVGFQLPPCSER